MAEQHMNGGVQPPGARFPYAAALFVFFSLAWISPFPVWAQLSLPPLPGGLVVSMTCPTSGSTVSATATVSARVSAVGVLVVGVQFKLDGADLGIEDTSGPYSVSWYTTTADNGSHTLRAVARDLVGLQFASEPVTLTVSNAPPPPPPAAFAPGDVFVSLENG